MPAPLIGLTTRNLIDTNYNFPVVASPRTYTEALARAGALPVLVPLNLPVEQHAALLDRLDGIVFTGGGDMAISHFNGEPHPKVYGVDDERDQIELALVQAVSRSTLPFLGICRGIQVINVALGGTLFTHISDQLPGALEHSCYPSQPPEYMAHTVQVEPESRLSQLLGADNLLVNSLHHQGIKDLAPGLHALAWAPDGLVEAFSLPQHPFGLAVQWHPEWLPDDPHMQTLFSGFVRAAAAYSSSRGVISV